LSSISFLPPGKNIKFGARSRHRNPPGFANKTGNLPAAECEMRRS
jgi:hypothetical protein